MNNVLIWCRLSAKRQLKRPLFLAFLLLFPLVLWGIGNMEDQSSDRIAVAMYSEDDSMSSEIMALLEEADGIFEFYVSGSREDLEADVAARRAECGYIFGADLKEKLDSGSYRRSITVVRAPSTVLAELFTEVVYSRLIEVYGRELLEDYSRNGGFPFLDGEQAWEQLEPLYDKYLSDGSTFSFQYVTEGQAEQEADSYGGTIRFPARGVGAVAVFIMGLFSSAWLARDEESGLFAAMPADRRLMCRGITAGIPVLLTGCSVLAAIYLASDGGNVLAEALLMAGYALAVTCVSMVLRGLVKRSAVVLGLIPFLAIASLVICPVFADLSVFIPAMRPLRWLFAPWYYLKGCDMFL